VDSIHSDISCSFLWYPLDVLVAILWIVIVLVLLRPIPRFKRPQGDFKDVWVPAIGMECRLFNGHYTELFLRMGYRYRPSPVPEQEGRTAFLDSDTHIVSVGLGVTFKYLIRRVMREPSSVDAHIQYFHLEERDYVRDLRVAASNRFGDIRFRGHVLNLGMTTTFRF
jgi:long-subunit fatty acid transport protein